MCVCVGALLLLVVISTDDYYGLVRCSLPFLVLLVKIVIVVLVLLRTVRVV